MIDKIKKKILSLEEPMNRLVVIFDSIKSKERFIDKFKEANEGNSYGWRDQKIEYNKSDFLVFRFHADKLYMYRYGNYNSGMECTNSDPTMYLINEKYLFHYEKGIKKKLEL